MDKERIKRIEEKMKEYAESKEYRDEVKRYKKKRGTLPLNKLNREFNIWSKERSKLEEIMYQIDSGYACGAVITKDDIIVETAPIFKKLLGQNINDIGYKKKRVGYVQEL